MVFIPTYLYVKKHTKTGLLYFGKTTKDPSSYKGSGTYWTNHIKKHGKDHIITLWYELFNCPSLLRYTATKFSVDHDIVNSKLWANLAIETGFDGGPRINNHLQHINHLPKSAESNKKRSNALKGRALRRKPILMNDICFLSITDAGRYYGVSDSTIHVWLKHGRGVRITLTKTII